MTTHNTGVGIRILTKAIAKLTKQLAEADVRLSAAWDHAAKAEQTALDVQEVLSDGRVARWPRDGSHPQVALAKARMAELTEAAKALEVSEANRDLLATEKANLQGRIDRALAALVDDVEIRAILEGRPA